MIVVVGSPHALLSEDRQARAAGLGSGIAGAAASGGCAVQVVGRVGEDAAGDAVLLDLARRGVGHVAVLRDAGRATLEVAAAPTDLDLRDEPIESPPEPSTLEAADLQLALSYLPEYRVIVVAEPLARDAMDVVVDAVGWSGAALVVATATDGATLPDDATVFEPPADGDPDGAFAAMVGTYAAGLDRGEDAKAAFEAAAASVGSTAAD